MKVSRHKLGSSPSNNRVGGAYKPGITVTLTHIYIY